MEPSHSTWEHAEHGAQASSRGGDFWKIGKWRTENLDYAYCSSIVNRPNEGTKLGRITQETLLDAAVPLDKAKYGCKILAKTSLPLTGKFVPSWRETGKLLPMDMMLPRHYYVPTVVIWMVAEEWREKKEEDNTRSNSDLFSKKRGWRVIINRVFYAFSYWQRPGLTLCQMVPRLLLHIIWNLDTY